MLYKLDDRFKYTSYPEFRKFYEKHKEKYKDDFLGLILLYVRGELLYGDFVYLCK